MNHRQKKEIDSILGEIPFLACLDASEKAALHDHVIVRPYGKNEIILREEDTHNYLYIVLTGKVKVVQIGAEQGEQILAIHKRGEFFGEMTLLDGQTAPATVMAMEESRIGFISHGTFVDHMLRNKKVNDEIIHYLCKRLREAWLKIRIMRFADAEQRIRITIRELGMKFGAPDPQNAFIALTITHQNIANLASTSRETVTRFLNQKKKEGEIEIRNHKQILLKHSFLNQIHLL